MCHSKEFKGRARNIIYGNNTAAYCIIDVMVYICNSVAYLNDLSLQSKRHIGACMVYNSVSDLLGKIHSPSGLCGFKHIDYTKALLIMFESAFMYLVKNLFTVMSKGCMPQVMTESNCLNQIFVEIKCSSYCSGNLRNLDCMCQSRSEMVPLRSKKYLSLMHEPSESF